MASLSEYLSVALAKDAVDKLQGVDFTGINVLVTEICRMLRDIRPFYGCPNRPYFTFRLQLLHLYQGGLDDVGIIRWVMYLIDVYVIGFKLSQRFFEIVAYQRNVLQRIALGGFCSDDDIVSNPHAIKSIANAFLRIEIHASGIDEIAAGIQIGLDDRFGLGFTDRAITNATDSPGS